MGESTESLIVGIRSDLSNLLNNFNKFETKMDERLNTMDSRLGTLEVAQGGLRERTSNLAIFQGAFSVVIGAIATYLGIQQK